MAVHYGRNVPHGRDVPIRPRIVAFRLGTVFLAPPGGSPWTRQIACAIAGSEEHSDTVTPLDDQHLQDLSPQDQETLRRVESLGQGHLVAHWSEPATSTRNKQRLLEQFRGLDAAYPGGMSRYIENARALLDAARRGDNPFEGFVPHVPEGVALTLGDDDFLRAEHKGLHAVNRCAFVLVAGGLGERLGFSGIKIALPAETATGRCFMQLYAEYILALQRRGNELSGGQHRDIPLAIMTSDDTHEATRTLLLDNDYFGLGSGQVTLLKQEKVASIMDATPRLALDADDRFQIQTKPHGHGDVHSLLYQSGLASRWLDAGVRHVVFFQDTNALAMNVVPATLGVSIERELEVNSIVVPRRAGEAVGGLVRLERGDTALTVNVEYNQLDPLLRATTQPDGDVPDETGSSPFPGNTNVLVMALEPYTRTLEKTGGSVPEFVNPKYVDEERVSFKSPTRLECMMQDYPKLLPSGALVGFTQFERDVCFSAVKNSLHVAAERQRQGLPAEAAATGEADLYALYRKLLRVAGAKVEPATASSYRGVEAELLPIASLSPALSMPLDRLSRRIRDVRISARSTLVLDADDVEIDGLDLDGALIVRAVPGARVVIRRLTVRNEGWIPRETSDAAELPPEIAIRGFELHRGDARVLEANEPREFVFAD